KIAKTSVILLHSGPGPIARLRRMDVTGPGEADFWQLAKYGGFLDEIAGDNWLRIVKIMSLLTPKGDYKANHVLHDPATPLGRLLCDGGNRDWSGPRPFSAEDRLMRFVAMPFEKRGDALERMARMLASSRRPNSGVNCVDIACLLFSADVKHTRKLAKTYYQRLDSKASQDTIGKDTVA